MVSADNTSLTDINERLIQYVKALNTLIQSGVFSTIIFCDNSGFSLDRVSSQLESKSGVNVELLSFCGDNKKVKSYGKGYGEGEIVNYALENSKFMFECKAFFKLTGRIDVKNIEAIVLSINKSYSRKKISSVFFSPPSLESGLLDTRFYFCSRVVFEKYLKNAHFLVSDNKGFYLEHAFFKCLENKISRKSVINYPDVVGISGSTGNSYQLSRKRKFKVLFGALFGRACFIVND